MAGRRAVGWLLAWLIGCAYAASSSSHHSSSHTAYRLPTSAKTPYVPLPKHSTNSNISASTGLASPAPVSSTIPKPDHPYLLQDATPIRSEVKLDATDGVFFQFMAKPETKLWLSLSLCSGPGIEAYNTSDSDLLKQLDMSPSEAREATLVAMYVATDGRTKNPGPDSGIDSSHTGHALGGWCEVVVESGSSDTTFIGIWPPKDTRGQTGTYTMQLIASTVGSLESVATSPGLFFDDTDRRNALLTSFNYTAPAPNISLIVLPTVGPNSLSSINYFNSSFCRIFDLWEHMGMRGIQPYMNSSETSRNTQPRFTRGPDNQPQSIPRPNWNGSVGQAPPGAAIVEDVAMLETVHKLKANSTAWLQQVRKQFYVQDLEPGSNYTAYLVASEHVGAHVRHTLYPSVKFVTKRTRNCRLLYNVDFCPELAYAVPYNPEQSQEHVLRVLHDMISANYGNFSATLSAFPCESTKFGVYSSVATCDDCRRAYQNWLCAVAIPRCTDLVDPSKSAASQNGSELQGLPMPPNTNMYPYIVNRVGPMRSRQSYIDELFAPGDYGEILPCLLTCEMVTRSCPPTIRWQCPLWTVTAQRDYGTFADADSTGFGVGENGGAGPDNMRFGGAYSTYVAQDAFGHVFCNSMQVDRLFRESSSGAHRRAVPLEAWVVLLGVGMYMWISAALG